MNRLVAPRFPCALVLAACLLGTVGSAIAQAWPAKPIRVLVGFAPGGSVDLTARILSAPIGEALGTPLIVENRPGASGNIAGEAAAKAAPDGYTTMMSSGGPLAANRAVIANMSFDPQRDFAGITLAAFQANIVVVNPRVPAKTVADLIRIAKSAPNKLSYGSAGVGSVQHLSTEMFRALTGAQMVHVPYKGGAPAVADLVAGHIDVMFDTISTSIRFVQDGKLRALAVTPMTRAAMLPSLPTVDESGLKGYEFRGWIGLVAPTKTPAPVISRLHAETTRALGLPDVQKRFAELGFDAPAPMAPAQFDAFMRDEATKYVELVKKAGIKPE
ncbi:MAG: tripartite tricarboxylate transporter substrate binding protein [Proteobacteria bacterium]|nr:tripartite tricarboxylate transporter substrate binding protein [Burkholderiales bacterium]